MGLSPSWVKPKTMKLMFAASPLSTQNSVVKAKTGLAWDQDNVSKWSDMSTKRTVVSVS